MANSSYQDPMTDKPVEELTYEQAFTELDEIVTALEADEHTLERALALYERGQALAHYCADLLDKAELKVQIISGDSLVPFEPQE